MGEAIFLFCVLVPLFIIWFYYQNPFIFPYIVIEIDASRRKLPDPEDMLDEYLNRYGMDKIQRDYSVIQSWKQEQERRIPKMFFSSHRYEQYLSVLDNEPIVVKLERQITKYRQINYQKYSYHEIKVFNKTQYSFSYICERYTKLERIGHECTIHQYEIKNQRKLMTPALRRRIMERDNYTCQNCGKYMPDGNGIEIDHVIPISRGGKTVPSNLQVLCQHCNRQKSNKVDSFTRKYHFESRV